MYYNTRSILYKVIQLLIKNRFPFRNRSNRLYNCRFHCINNNTLMNRIHSTSSSSSSVVSPWFTNSANSNVRRKYSNIFSNSVQTNQSQQQQQTQDSTFSSLASPSDKSICSWFKSKNQPYQHPNYSNNVRFPNEHFLFPAISSINHHQLVEQQHNINKSDQNKSDQNNNNQNLANSSQSNIINDLILENSKLKLQLNLLQHSIDKTNKSIAQELSTIRAQIFSLQYPSTDNKNNPEQRHSISRTKSLPNFIKQIKIKQYQYPKKSSSYVNVTTAETSNTINSNNHLLKDQITEEDKLVLNTLSTSPSPMNDTHHFTSTSSSSYSPSTATSNTNPNTINDASNDTQQAGVWYDSKYITNSTTNNNHF
jgi:hypothetical protein